MANDQYDDEMKGVLFRNRDKDPNNPAHAKRPDYKGHLTIGGNRIEQAAWLRTSSRTGEKFMSFAYEVPQPKTEGAAPAPQQAQPVKAAPVVQQFGDEPPF